MSMPQESSGDRDESFPVELVIDGPAAVLTLARPRSYNTLGGDMRRAIAAALDDAVGNRAVRGVILTGGPDVFAAGADVREFVHRRPLDSFAPMAATPDIWGQIAALKVPVIAAVAGLALGGGMELALACDLRVAADTARFGQTEINLGLIPGRGGTQRLPRLIGMTRAKEMVLTGRRITAAEALDWGLVNKVVPIDQLLAEAKHYVEAIAAKPPLAVHMAKLMLARGQNVALDAALTMESLAFANMFSTADVKEGLDAFLHKRRPEYVGS